MKKSIVIFPQDGATPEDFIKLQETFKAVVSTNELGELTDGHQRIANGAVAYTIETEKDLSELAKTFQECLKIDYPTIKVNHNGKNGGTRGKHSEFRSSQLVRIGFW